MPTASLASSPSSLPQPRRLGRSAAALGAGFATLVALSLGVDQLLHVFGVYPPWGQPMFSPALNALALGYRLVFDTLGCFVTARLAPRAPMAHALALGACGLVLSLIPLAAAEQVRALGPLWYPALLAASSLPTAWLGGRLAARRADHPATFPLEAPR